MRRKSHARFPVMLCFSTSHQGGPAPGSCNHLQWKVEYLSPRMELRLEINGKQVDFRRHWVSYRPYGKMPMLQIRFSDAGWEGGPFDLYEMANAGYLAPRWRERDGDNANTRQLCTRPPHFLVRSGSKGATQEGWGNLTEGNVLVFGRIFQHPSSPINIPSADRRGHAWPKRDDRWECSVPSFVSPGRATMTPVSSPARRRS